MEILIEMFILFSEIRMLIILIHLYLLILDKIKKNMAKQCIAAMLNRTPKKINFSQLYRQIHYPIGWQTNSKNIFLH
jgi:hypothetical protein